MKILVARPRPSPQKGTHDEERDTRAMIDLLTDQDPWIPATSGERLLFLLLRYHSDWRALSTALKTANAQMARRHDGLTNFFVGASVLHLQQRLIRQGQDVRELYPYDRSMQIGEMVIRMRDVIGLGPVSYGGDYSALVDEVLTSAEQLDKPMGPGLKKAVKKAGPGHCHSCGLQFDIVPQNGSHILVATADHVWPRSLGGDTIEDNLISACDICNSKKGHIAAWQMAWIQPVVFSEFDEASSLKSFPRDLRIALHIRVAMAYAQANMCTLKNAFLTIGPREDPVRIDPDQGYDFFNLRVHDPARTNVNWMPT